MEKIIRIGGASGAWGDSDVAVPQLLHKAKVDYLVFDYLAELTMAILAGARAQRPELGYAPDFVATMRQSLPEIMRGGVRVVANAGGMNPQGCVAAIEAVANELGLSPKVACITGDDVMPMIESLRGKAIETGTGATLPEKPLSANAYLGALPIKSALDEGADIVVTGRCVDSAVTLGVLMHEFGWSADQHDLMAAGSLAGHIIECGRQATGGLYTDWESVPGWDDMGYPIIEARADGSFTVTKPEGTGGVVCAPAIAEQVLYEIGDPARYILPDVVCDFTQLNLRQAGPDRVEVTGVRGTPPTPHYKVCATYADGFKSVTTLTIIGFEAAAKARRTADAILSRTRALFQATGLPDYSDTLVEVLGSESSYGPHGRTDQAREVVLRLAVLHQDKRALEIFSREIGTAGMSYAPGTTGLSGRPKASPNIRLFSFLLEKTALKPVVHLAGVAREVAVPAGEMSGPADAVTAPEADIPILDGAERPLIELAHGRSGDKGDLCNIGIVARKPEYLPILRSQLTPQRVRKYLGHLVDGSVTRYDLPGLSALNFVCEQALAGGVAGSLRNDPWGKGIAQILLSFPIRIPHDFHEVSR